MGFGEVGGGPLRGVVGVGVVEADDVLAAVAAFALDADQVFGIDVVAIVGGVGAGIAGAGGGGDDARAIVFDMAEGRRSTRGGRFLRRGCGGRCGRRV